MFPWFPYYIACSVLMKAWSTYLDYRQFRHVSRAPLPEELSTLVTNERFEKSVAYSLDKLKFGITTSTFGFILHLLLLLTYAYVYLWEISISLCGNCKQFKSAPDFVESLIFIGLTTILDEVTSIGFELYFDFVIEEKHGFNRKTIKIFITDKLKTYFLMVLIGVPLIWVLIALVHLGGQKFYFYLWIFFMVFAVFMMVVYPNFIAPLFDKYEALKDESLREKIVELANNVQFPLKKVYQIDASKRSAHSNAYFYGIWSIKYIVLYDTLLNLPHPQILSVLAHEIGHWKLNHVIKNLLASFINMFFVFYFFGIVYFESSIYQSFGFPENVGRPVIIGLFLFTKVYEPIMMFIEMFMIVLSRTFEFQADTFASTLGYNNELKGALVALQDQNLATFSVDPLYAWFHYNHPTLVERIQHLKKIEKKSK